MTQRTLAQEVAQRLRSELASGAFQPGDKLPPERELMIRYSAGRNTVREAVQGLVALGMLEVQAGRGTTVTRADGRLAIARTVSGRRLDESAMQDLLEFRLLLEGDAAALAAERASDEDMELIRRELAAYQGAVRRSEDVYAHDVAFHRAISAGAHNSIYLEVIDTTSQLFMAAMRISDRMPGDILEAAAEHALIAHHVLLGDAEAAKIAMREHISAGNRRRLQGDAAQADAPSA